jgi:hypothetical protein
MTDHEYSCQKEVDSVCACMGIRSESFDFFLSKRLYVHGRRLSKHLKFGREE